MQWNGDLSRKGKEGGSSARGVIWFGYCNPRSSRTTYHGGVKKRGGNFGSGQRERGNTEQGVCVCTAVRNGAGLPGHLFFHSFFPLAFRSWSVLIPFPLLLFLCQGLIGSASIAQRNTFEDLYTLFLRDSLCFA